MSVKKGETWKNGALIKANKILLSTQASPRK